ncbi:hypothetical protein [Thiocystis violacea]|uniref:hypothetical protein n=1 Tax=Thiocystis violacea TaxID=13725 RepID=UPI0019060F28|nr:hypothetical protein [Thiocystis violacea]MBK1720981.1 hypothetical protein [Thiocystis violacea]
MLDFPLSLALFNVLPVLLTGVAMWFIAAFVGRTNAPAYPMVLLGGGLVLAGGLCKASWKLIAAATGQDIQLLAVALFPLMAPGFLLLAIAVWGAARQLRGREPLSAWRLALGLLSVVLAAVAVREWVLDIPRGWFLPLLVSVSLGNLVTSIQLIAASLYLRRRTVAALFALNLVMVFALPPIAMVAEKTLSLHWLEQSLTALGSGCLALAAVLLWRVVRRGARPGEGIVWTGS